MITTRRALVAAMAAAWLLSGPALADMKALEEAAKKEGEVTWYVGNLDGRNAELAGRAFTARYGIKVNVVRAPSQTIYQRMAQDLSQGVRSADVFGSVDLGHLVELKSKGALAQYMPQNAAQLLPAFQGLDPDGTFHATLATLIVLAYNTQKVKAEEAPKSWSDLLDPKWANKIALGHPAFSGFAGNWAAQVHKLYGKSYFERLEKLRPQVGRSLLDSITLLASGERLVSASTLANMMESADKGNPIAIQYPTEGAIFIATPSGILKNAPHPNAGRLFLEWLLGVEWNETLVKSRYEPMRADVKPLPGVKALSEIKFIRPTIDETVKGIPEVAELWRNVFGQ